MRRGVLLYPRQARQIIASDKVLTDVLVLLFSLQRDYFCVCCIVFSESVVFVIDDPAYLFRIYSGTPFMKHTVEPPQIDHYCNLLEWGSFCKVNQRN